MGTAGGLAGADGAGAGLIDAAAAVNGVAERFRPVAVPRRASTAAAGSRRRAAAGREPRDAARGRRHDGDGVPDPLTGEQDTLGNAWDGPAWAANPWTSGTWARSPWAPLVAEIRGSGPAPRWTGPPAPLMAWEAAYFGARSAADAGWDAKYWGAKYWGTGAWQ